MPGAVSSIFGGGSSNTSSQSSSTPVDMTPSAFAALQSPLASSLSSLFAGGPTYGGISSTGAPLSTTPVATTPNTFSAPLSGNEGSILGTLMGVGGQPSPQMNAANGYVSSVLNPNYLSTFLSSPAVTGAIGAATAPIIQAFNTQTMPGLKGSFVANGAVLNGPKQVGPGATASGSGSSAFDKAASIAQTGEGQALASAAAPIEQQALALGTGQQEQAATQAAQLSATEINNLVSTLQAEALPRLIQQYGLDQGLQQFNNRVNVALQSLGLAAQKAGPYIANQSEGSSQSNYLSQPGLFSDLFGSQGISQVVPFLSNIRGLFSGAGTAGAGSLFGADALGTAGAGAAGAGDAMASILPMIMAA